MLLNQRQFYQARQTVIVVIVSEMVEAVIVSEMVEVAVAEVAVAEVAVVEAATEAVVGEAVVLPLILALENVKTLSHKMVFLGL